MANEIDQDGLVLALGAISEVLTKQSGVLDRLLTKMDEEAEEEDKKAEEEAVEEEKEELVKMLKAEILKELSAANATNTGADSDEKKKTISTTPGPAKNKALPGTQPEQKQQEVIQAADDAEDEAEDKKDEDEEDKEYPEVEKLSKQIAELQKNMADMIQVGVNDRLRKMGWREETGLVSPRRVAMGVNDTPVLKKGMEKEDRIAELAKLDYATLKKMEIESEAGELPEGIAQFVR